MTSEKCNQTTKAIISMAMYGCFFKKKIAIYVHIDRKRRKKNSMPIWPIRTRKQISVFLYYKANLRVTVRKSKPKEDENYGFSPKQFTLMNCLYVDHTI